MRRSLRALLVFTAVSCAFPQSRAFMGTPVTGSPCAPGYYCESFSDSQIKEFANGNAFGTGTAYNGIHGFRACPNDGCSVYGGSDAKNQADAFCRDGYAHGIFENSVSYTANGHWHSCGDNYNVRWNDATRWTNPGSCQGEKHLDSIVCRRGDTSAPHAYVSGNRYGWVDDVNQTVQVFAMEDDGAWEVSGSKDGFASWTVQYQEADTLGVTVSGLAASITGAVWKDAPASWTDCSGGVFSNPSSLVSGSYNYVSFNKSCAWKGTPGKAYRFRMKATDRWGNSAVSQPTPNITRIASVSSLPEFSGKASYGKPYAGTGALVSFVAAVDAPAKIGATGVQYRCSSCGGGWTDIPACARTWGAGVSSASGSCVAPFGAGDDGKKVRFRVTATYAAGTVASYSAGTPDGAQCVGTSSSGASWQFDANGNARTKIRDCYAGCADDGSACDSKTIQKSSPSTSGPVPAGCQASCGVANIGYSSASGYGINLAAGECGYSVGSCTIVQGYNPYSGYTYGGCSVSALLICQ